MEQEISAVNPVQDKPGGDRRKVSVQQVRGEFVKDIITKFFYRDNHLCFHILLLVEGEGTVLFQEFADYAEYKKSFSVLQQAKSMNSIIQMPKNKIEA